MGYGHAVDELWDAQAPFTVALVDLDNLKYANDAFGHDEGNHYILTVAELLRACCREGDGSGAYRIGGDEFVLISPRDTESSLASRLEKARDELVEKSTATEPMTFSFSYGCSKVHPDEGGSRKDITADADRKMYRYKLAHRSAQQRMRNVPGAAAARGGDFNARFFTERVFEALAMAIPGRYQFVIDIESDRSRWSANAVTDLGIPSANLENTTKDCRYGQDSCGLLGIKVDGVAEINATLGYEAGDRALSLLSARLLSVLRGRGLAYRARGSEFVALVRGGCERDIVELRQEVSAQLAKPIRFEGEELPVSMRYAVVFLDLVDRQPLSILNDLDQRLREGASTLGRAGDGQGDGREGSQAGDAHAPSRRGVGLGQARTAGEKRLDPLTGLLCSSDFIETAREWCRANPAEQWAFVALDIDNLPIFYEWHGKEEGKLLVSEVAGVLRGMQGESKLCAGYWGEDDFSLLVALGQELLDEVYRRVREVVASHDSSVGFLPSMGVYMLESAQELGDDCYAKASFANTQGKEHFETRIWFFRAADWKRQFDEHLMLSDFHYALRQGRIGFALQPQIVWAGGASAGPRRSRAGAPTTSSSTRRSSSRSSSAPGSSSCSTSTSGNRSSRGCATSCAAASSPCRSRSTSARSTWRRSTSPSTSASCSKATGSRRACSRPRSRSRCSSRTPTPRTPLSRASKRWASGSSWTSSATAWARSRSCGRPASTPSSSTRGSSSRAPRRTGAAPASPTRCSRSRAKPASA